MYLKSTIATLFVGGSLLLATATIANAQTSNYTIGNKTSESVKSLRISGWKVVNFERIRPQQRKTFVIENDGGDCVVRVSVKFSNGNRDDKIENVCKPDAGTYFIGR
ncbi:hypothetical protein [Maritalea sp. S77]|uniref:hypothetical protein n=1 Tax=Maritalea sp. S77 TaxID=3415125 RepID=UPI003C7E3C77